MTRDTQRIGEAGHAAAWRRMALFNQQTQPLTAVQGAERQQAFREAVREAVELAAEADARSRTEEFSGVDTAPDDPRHVEQVINHLAHLEDEQVEAIRRELASWKGESMKNIADAWNSEQPTAEQKYGEQGCTCPMSVRDAMPGAPGTFPAESPGEHHSRGCPLSRPLSMRERRELRDSEAGIRKIPPGGQAGFNADPDRDWGDSV